MQAAADCTDGTADMLGDLFVTVTLHVRQNDGFAIVAGQCRERSAHSPAGFGAKERLFRHHAGALICQTGQQRRAPPISMAAGGRSAMRPRTGSRSFRIQRADDRIPSAPPTVYSQVGEDTKQPSLERTRTIITVESSPYTQ